MNKTKIGALIMSVCMTFGTFSGLSVQAAGTSMVIDTSKVIRTATGELYGLSTDYAVEETIVNVDDNGNINNNVDILKALNEYKLPLVRLGEGATREAFQWKYAIGDYSQRTEQTLWGVKGKIAPGPLEQVKFYEAADKDASFTVTINMMGDTAESAGDYAEFLTGSADTVWGAKRAAMGHSEPVNVKAYELGNETEWDGGSNTNVLTEAQYIAKAKEFIAEIEAADPDAKFAIHADTTAYNTNRSSDSWRDWHNTILQDAALAEKIDYVAVHAYFEPNVNDGINGIISELESDILAKTGSDRIKVYLSEYAVYYEEGVSNPHNLRSVINTANVLSRIVLDKNVGMTAYHGLDSSNWRSIMYNPKKDQVWLNGIGHMLKTFKEYGVGDVVESTFTGFSKDAASTSSSGIAVKTDKGVNLIFTNATDEAMPVDLSFTDGAEYVLKDQTVITRENANITPFDADIDYDISTMVVNKYSYDSEETVLSHTVPAYSVCAVSLEKKEAKNETVIWNNVSSGIYNVFGDASGSVNLQGSSLVLKSGDDTTYGDINYTYLPYNNVNADFNFEADIQVDTLFDGGLLGVILNSSVKNDVPTGNMIKFSAIGTNEVTITEGSESDPIINANAKIAAGNTYKLAVTQKGDKVSVTVDGVTLYERSGSLENATGYMGFMFSDVNCTVKNIKFVEYQENSKVDYAKEFAFSENFDNVADGMLPEGWEAMSGKAVAGVFDGELVLDSQEWWSSAWVKIPGLENVNRSGLIMEADIRYISHNAEARTGGARNQGGFAYMANGSAISTSGLLTFTTQSETCEYGKSTLGAGNACDFSDGEVKKLQIVFAASGSPDIYIDGVKSSPEFPHAETSNNVGAIGLQARAAKVAFDNIVVKGTTNESIDAEKMVYSDFTYVENFDDYADGAKPAGFTLIDASASAIVEGGELKVTTTNAWWKQSGVLIDSLKNVKREGLTVEMDMTLISYDEDCESAGARTGATFMFTDGTKTGYYMMKAKKDEYGSFIWVRDGVTANGNAIADNFTAGEKIKFKLVFSANDYTATGYMNGAQIRSPLDIEYYKGQSAYIEPAVNEGQIGLGGFGTVVKFDNIRITGKKLMPAEEVGNVKAEFAGGITKFASVEEAIAAVKVSYTDATTDGYIDVTADADIKAAAKSETEYEITASYKGLSDVLLCTVKSVVYYDFVYEENFESYAEGTAPAGFTPIDANASAVIENGALVVTTTDAWWKQSGVLIDSLKGVKREGLTIEMDMTLVSYDGNAENSGVRTGATFMFTDGTKTGYYMMKAKKDEYGSFIWVRDGVTANGNAIADNFTAGETIKFKLVFSTDDYTATGYMNGTQIRTPLDIEYYKGQSAYIEPAVNEGQIGLGGFGTVVKYDNIRITGKKAVDEAITTAKFAASSKNFANGKLAVGVDLEDNSGKTSTVYLAVYEKATKRLVAVDGASYDAANYPISRVNLEVSGIAGYSADTHEVKIMTLDNTNLKPIAASVKF